MEDKNGLKPLQPVSIHPSISHPLMIATAVILLPLLLCILAGTFLLVSLNPNFDPVAVTPPDPSRDRMEKFEVANAVERQAVCNDGSPAAYYYRPGVDEDRDNWVIFLEGMEACDTSEACIERSRHEPHRTSSKNYPPNLSPQGILSAFPSDNPDFWSYNQVYIKYCSSDLWSGDSTQVIDDNTWEFKGDKIFTAVIEDLQTKAISAEHHLGEADEVILAGSAAGGMGVSYQLDSLAEILSFADVTGVMDSAWYPSELTKLDGTPAFDYASMFTYWNSQLDATCVARNADEPWVCLSPVDNDQYTATSTFVSVDQSDEYLLGVLGITDSTDPDQALLVDTTRNAIKDSIVDLTGVFSTNQGLYTELASDRFTQITINDQSYAQVLGDWFFSRSNSTRVIEE